MGLQVGQFDARCAMVFFRKADSYLLIEREPLLWVWRVVRIVAIQRVVLPVIVGGNPKGGSA